MMLHVANVNRSRVRFESSRVGIVEVAARNERSVNNYGSFALKQVQKVVACKRSLSIIGVRRLWSTVLRLNLSRDRRRQDQQH